MLLERVDQVAREAQEENNIEDDQSRPRTGVDSGRCDRGNPL